MRRGLNIILLCIFLLAEKGISAQFLNNFSHRAKVEVAPDGSGDVEVLMDFPYYFEYQNLQLRSKVNGGLVDSEEGLDIWFGQADATILYSEIEYYDPASGTVSAWIRIPEYTPGSGYGFYMHVGNPLLESRPGSSFVWSDDFAGVWHMADNADDASGNGSNGIVYGANYERGVSGYGLRFNGTTDSLIIPNTSALNLTEGISIEAWIEVTDDEDDNWVIAGKYLDYWLSYNSDIFSFWAGEQNLDTKMDLDENTWYHIVGTYDRSMMRIYLNGNEIASQANTAAISNDDSEPFAVGCYPQEPGTWNFPGYIDEVRIHKTALDPKWITTCVDNMGNARTNITVSEFFLSSSTSCRAIEIDLEDELENLPFLNVHGSVSTLPLTECAGYNGNDMWFKTIVPDNGGLRISTATDPTPELPRAADWIMRTGLAVYEGSCSTPVFNSCWIDEVVSAPHIQPDIELTDLTPGEELYMRVWGYSGESGFFSIELSSMDLAVFEVSGSAAYCDGDGGSDVTLSGSEVDMIYQLQRNGIDFGAALTGDGNALTWSNIEEGVYEVAAMEVADGPRVKMDAKAVITRNPLPVTNFGYSYEKSLFIEADSVYGTTDLTDFPVLVQISSESDLAAITNGGHVANSSGYDIAFTDENFLPLAFELTDYDPGTGSLEAWVKVPLLSASSDTELHLIYGNESIASDLSSKDVWSPAYKQVLHMDEDLADASSKGNYGSGDSLDLVSGKISSSRYFDGNNDMLVTQNDTSLESTSEHSTLSLWIKFDNTADGEHQLILSDEDRYSVGQGYEWAVQGNGNHFFYPNGNHNMNYNMGSNPFINGQWHYLVSTLELESKEVKLYIDGKPQSFFEEFVPVNWADAATFSSWLWGGNPDRSARNFAGNMDEIRVQGMVRSQEWILTEYSNQNSPTSFISLSDERAYTGFDALCDSADQITLEQALPSGGSFFGNGVNGLSFDPSLTGAGEYDIIYTYTDAQGCSSMNTSSIAVIANPAPYISGEDIVQENAMDEAYTTTFISGNTYNWELISDDASISSGQGESSILVDWGLTSGVLTVTETDTVYGCIGVSSSYEVFVTADSIPVDGIIIPDVFTPNDDGWNDRFEIIGLDIYPGNMLTIFNVNGMVIYQAGNYDSSWDGTSTIGSNAGNLLPTGTYYYVLELNSETRIKGFVYLRRE